MMKQQQEKDEQQREEEQEQPPPADEASDGVNTRKRTRTQAATTTTMDASKDANELEQQAMTQGAHDNGDNGIVSTRRPPKRKAQSVSAAATTTTTTEAGNDKRSSSSSDNHPQTVAAQQHESTWMSHYHKLIEFKNEHGHCEVPQRYKPDQAFGKWVKSQREYYKALMASTNNTNDNNNTRKKRKNSLTPERIALLNKIDFAWVSTKTKRTVMKDFEVHLAELQQYKILHGHTRVPHVYQDNPGLGVFCHRAKIYRREMKEGKRKSPNDWLTETRIEALEGLDFEWRVGRWQHAPSWEERYAQLVEFKDAYGHCNVSADYERIAAAPGLKAWVINQKSYLARSLKEKKVKSAVASAEEKIAALKSLGIEFEHYDESGGTSSAHVDATPPDANQKSVPPSAQVATNDQRGGEESYATAESPPLAAADE